MNTEDSSILCDRDLEGIRGAAKNFQVFDFFSSNPCLLLHVDTPIGTLFVVFALESWGNWGFPRVKNVES